MNRDINKFLETIRLSFHDAPIVYTRGGCYGLYQIVKQVFPKAQAYFSDLDEDHILIKLDNKFYDIYGIKKFKDAEIKEVKKLSKEDHEYWKSVASGQRLEAILAKYERYCERIKKDI